MIHKAVKKSIERGIVIVGGTTCSTLTEAFKKVDTAIRISALPDNGYEPEYNNDGTIKSERQKRRESKKKS